MKTMSVSIIAATAFAAAAFVTPASATPTSVIWWTPTSPIWWDAQGSAASAGNGPVVCQLPAAHAGGNSVDLVASSAADCTAAGGNTL